MYRATADFRTLHDAGVIAGVALDPPAELKAKQDAAHDAGGAA
ncbi:hypothetical protein [Methylobacterium ajmalii]|nr:hypothetical protein [Methylobacterium ajmalii]